MLPTHLFGGVSPSDFRRVVGFPLRQTDINQRKPALAWFINQNRNTIPIPVYAKGTGILTSVCIPKPE